MAHYSTNTKSAVVLVVGFFIAFILYVAEIPIGAYFPLIPFIAMTIAIYVSITLRGEDPKGSGGASLLALVVGVMFAGFIVWAGAVSHDLPLMITGFLIIPMAIYVSFSLRSDSSKSND